MKSNSQRVLISMPAQFLQQIDKVAGDENRSRSELIREALRKYMHKNTVRANRNAAILEDLLEGD